MASLGKGVRQRSTIQETLKLSRTTAEGLFEVDHLEVLQISPEKGRKHRLMIRETLKVPRITIHELLEDEPFEVLQVNTIDTWLTPYKRYPANGLLPSEPVGQDCQEEHGSVYPERWEPILVRLYLPTPHLCKWRPMHPNNVRASRGCLW